MYFEIFNTNHIYIYIYLILNPKIVCTTIVRVKLKVNILENNVLNTAYFFLKLAYLCFLCHSLCLYSIIV